MMEEVADFIDRLKQSVQNRLSLALQGFTPTEDSPLILLFSLVTHLV